jgi:hypothetical protein
VAVAPASASVGLCPPSAERGLGASVVAPSSDGCEASGPGGVPLSFPELLDEQALAANAMAAVSAVVENGCIKRFSFVIEWSSAAHPVDLLHRGWQSFIASKKPGSGRSSLEEVGMRSAVVTSMIVLTTGCGSPGNSGYSLDVGGDDSGRLSLPSSGGGATSVSSLDAHIEENQVAVSIVVLACAGDCADIEAVATGGTPPYSYEWEDGSTSEARHVCSLSSTHYSVAVTDTGTTGELGRAAQTAKSSVAASVMSCPDSGGGGRGDSGGLDATNATVLAHVTVPATTDIWLAGQPTGAALAYPPGQDVVPTNSPVEVPVVAGRILELSASGSTTHEGFCYAPSPDGGCIPVVNAGPANGISSIVVITDALIGVFTGSSAPSGSAPAGQDFTGANTAFTSLSPALNEVFFIGDGLTGTGSGTAQQFVVPAGATRLFLASSDALGAAYDNAGQFAVTVLEL